MKAIRRLWARLRRLIHNSINGCRPAEVEFCREDGTYVDDTAIICSCHKMFYIPPEVRGWVWDALRRYEAAMYDAAKRGK